MTTTADSEQITAEPDPPASSVSVGDWVFLPGDPDAHVVRVILSRGAVGVARLGSLDPTAHRVLASDLSYECHV